MSIEIKKESIDNVLARMAAPHRSYRISHLNLESLVFPEPQIFETILFDTILKCNLQCIYCHNPRYDGSVKEDVFKKFLDTQVKAVGNFQFGCAMEPLMDKKLDKFIKIVANSHAKPNADFRIQTNGILLDKQDIDLWKKHGINTMSISLDTLNSKIHKDLRDGSDLEIILRNIKRVRKNWPQLKMWLVTTVNKENLNGLKKLVKYAVDLGINGIEMRKMYHFSTSTVIKDHQKMQSMMLSNVAFANTMEMLQAKYDKHIQFCINDEKTLNTAIKKEVT